MRVSVIIPVYNTAHYLPDCLQSVLQQGVSSIEVICVDDGSTDKSASLLAESSTRDPRVRVISQPNAGQGAARNRAIAAAAGDYLLFVDSDDILVPGALRILLEQVRDADVIAFEHLTFTGKTPDIVTGNPTAKKVPREQLLRQMGVVWNKMVRRLWWIQQRLSFQEGVIYEDIPVHWKLVLLPSNITYLNSELYALRLHESSTTAYNRSSLRRLDSIHAFDMVGDFLNFSGQMSTYRQIYLERMLGNLAACYIEFRASNSQGQSIVEKIIRENLKVQLHSQGAMRGLKMAQVVALYAAQGNFPAQVAQAGVDALRRLRRFIRHLILR